MQFLPSLLEYSTESLDKKIEAIKSDSQKFLEITSQTKPIKLHLDFVDKYFAQDRMVMQSLEVKTVLNSVNDNFGETSLELYIHLMGDTEDLLNDYKFFEDFTTNSNHKYYIFVPPKFFKTWSTNFKENKSIKIGIWLDKGNWNTFRYMPGVNYLLMTVLAGKSGQKLTNETMTLAMNTVKTHPDSLFLVDGGWEVEFKSNYKNLMIVSHTSFWNKFNSKN